MSGKVYRTVISSYFGSIIQNHGLDNKILPKSLFIPAINHNPSEAIFLTN